MSKDYVLLKFTKNWADEFNVYGFRVLKNEEFDLLSAIMDDPEIYNAEMSYQFGSNQGWDDETIGDFWSSLLPVLINSNYAAFLIYNFGQEYGHFPDFDEILGEFQKNKIIKEYYKKLSAGDFDIFP